MDLRIENYICHVYAYPVLMHQLSRWCVSYGFCSLTVAAFKRETLNIWPQYGNIKSTEFTKHRWLWLRCVSMPVLQQVLQLLVMRTSSSRAGVTRQLSSCTSSPRIFTGSRAACRNKFWDIRRAYYGIPRYTHSHTPLVCPVGMARKGTIGHLVTCFFVFVFLQGHGDHDPLE